MHPDREQDPAEHERKTELMQQVNKAYRSKDLLAMLELSIEHIDQDNINNIAALRTVKSVQAYLRDY